jgi:tyramine---L-glutamate ligase
LTHSPQSIELPREPYVIQEFVAGTAASAAMIVGKSNHIVISVNAQNMTFVPAPKYCGGTIPLVHPLSQKAIDCVSRIPDAIPGLRGYVGVDMVITDDTVYLIEVNPRITFTYCGLRRIVRENLIDVIVDAGLGFELDKMPLTGSVTFDGSGRILEEIHPEQISEQMR